MNNCNFCENLVRSFSLSSKDALIDSPKFNDSYSKGKHLGSGNYATVRQCQNLLDGKYYAVKIVNKIRLSDEEKNALEEEISILETLNHPKVMRFFDKFEDYRNVYLITELITGGQLYDRIEKKKTCSEKETVDTCKSIFYAIKYCHDQNIVHRDIKPENILLTSEENDTDVKLADFGFATYVNGTNRTTLCGSPSFVASEIVRRKSYGVKVDIWSTGIIVYTLLSGYLPFEDIDLNSLFRKIARGKFSFPEKEWGKVSQKAKDLVSGLLCVDPSKRLSADEALNCEWLKEKEDILSAKSLNESKSRLHKLNELKKKHGGAREVTIREGKKKVSKKTGYLKQ